MRRTCPGSKIEKRSTQSAPGFAKKEGTHGGYRGRARGPIAARGARGQCTVQAAWSAGRARYDLTSLRYPGEVRRAAPGQAWRRHRLQGRIDVDADAGDLRDRPSD